METWKRDTLNIRSGEIIPLEFFVLNWLITVVLVYK